MQERLGLRVNLRFIRKPMCRSEQDNMPIWQSSWAPPLCSLVSPQAASALYQRVHRTDIREEQVSVQIQGLFDRLSSHQNDRPLWAVLLWPKGGES